MPARCRQPGGPDAGVGRLAEAQDGSPGSAEASMKDAVEKQLVSPELCGLRTCVHLKLEFAA